jgi:hypothetical protein
LLAGPLSFVTPSHAIDLNGRWSSDPALCVARALPGSSAMRVDFHRCPP